jgi:hypothetical protein
MKKKILMFLLLSIFAASSSRAQTIYWHKLNSPSVNGPLLADDSVVYDGSYRSSDFGKSWHNLGDGFYPLLASDSNSYAVLNTTLYRSTDEGFSWDSLPSSPPNPIYCIIERGDTLIAGAGGISRSTDHGSSWSSIDTITAFGQLLSTGPVYTMSSEGDLVVAFSLNEGLYISSNFGGSWKFIYPPYVAASSIQIDGGSIFIGTLGGIQCSRDGGQTWPYVLSGISGKFSPSPVVSAQGPTLLAASTSGVYFSGDTGETWSKADGGLNDTIAGGVAIGGSNFYTIDNSGGVYINNPAASGVGIIKQQSPCSIAPNPVENFATLHYSLSTPSEVTITISDLLGREAQKLLRNDWQSAGDHNISIDVRNLSIGMYECALETSGGTINQKIAVVK